MPESIPETRVGLGHDTHRLEPGRDLILGSVLIPHVVGLSGHSDADIVLHALTDALLGAAGLGDIGELFPDTDAQWKGVESSFFVREALRKISLNGWVPVNVDIVIHAEKPKLSPFKPAIRAAISKLMGMDEERVNIKAKTGEKVGPVGRGEAMECHVIALIRKH